MQTSKAQTSNLQTSKHKQSMSPTCHMCGQCLHANFQFVKLPYNHKLQCLHACPWCQMSTHISWYKFSNIHTQISIHVTTSVNVSMHVTLWSQLPTQTSHSGKCSNMSHGSQLQTNFLDTKFQNVCGEANFQLTNFHNINFQSGVEWSGELPICKFQSTNFQLADFQHMTVNVSKHVTWQSMSSCIPHGVKCLHTFTWLSMSPYQQW